MTVVTDGRIQTMSFLIDFQIRCWQRDTRVELCELLIAIVNYANFFRVNHSNRMCMRAHRADAR